MVFGATSPYCRSILASCHPLHVRKIGFILGDSVATHHSKTWYAGQPCGENKLGGMVKSMFAEIGVSGKTNHSLRATGASDIFQAGVPERLFRNERGIAL